MRTFAIIGCGNIGYRHLQSLCAYAEDCAINVVEPDSSRLRECIEGSLRPETSAILQGFSSLDELLETDPSFNAVICATTTDVLKKVREKIFQLRSAVFLLEKPLAQSREDLNQLVGMFSDKRPVPSVYVNCARNLWSGYADLKQALTKSKCALRLDISGNAWGYGCNAIHFIELFRFLTDAHRVRCVSSVMTSSPMPAKRGSSYEEFVGTASFASEKGHLLTLTCGFGSEKSGAPVISVQNMEDGTIQFLVDEASNHWIDLRTTQRSPLGMRFVSESTRLFVSQMLGTGTTTNGRLPNCRETVVSHSAFFESLELATGRSHFNIT